MIKHFLSKSLKLAKTVAVMKHYKKMFLSKQYLGEVLSLYFDFLLNDLQVKNAKD